MQRCFKLAVLVSLLLESCNSDSDKEIRKLLAESTATARIEGAYKAGESGDKKYIPLLLHNAWDPSASTSLHYKGFTVYTETMFALERITHVKPPHSYKQILTLPDSANVKFYSALWHNMNKGK